MNRTVITVLVTLVVILGGATAVLWIQYRNATATPDEKIVMLTNNLTGKAELILAEDKNVYQEYTRTFKNGPGKAKVLFRWLTTFQYMVDLSDPLFKIVKDGAVIKVTCPPLKMNEPAIDIAKYKAGIILESSMWIDEHKMIADEMARFKSKSDETGLELMKNPQIIKLCTDQLRLIVLEVVSGLQIQSDKVEIEFGS